MKKGNVFLITILTITILVVSFALYLSKSKNINYNEYISFTCSEYVNENNDQIISKILYLDPETAKIIIVHEFSYTTQYPLGIYDKENNRVYYTKKSDNDNSGDQIYLFDLKLKEEQQLTKDLFAVNYIIPHGSQVFFVARPEGASAIKLGCINLDDKSIGYWNDDGDTNIEAITINRKHEKIYLSTYSEKERVYNVTHQDGPAGQNNFKMPRHHLYQTNFSFIDFEELLSTDMWIRTVMSNDTEVVALCDVMYNNEANNSILLHYDIQSKAISQSEWNYGRLRIGDANYSADGKSIYSLVQYADKRSICKFDFSTLEFTPLFIPKEEFINNITIVR